MSTKLTGYVWDGCAASGMKLSSVAIMARLADFSNDEGVCWPSIETIARQIGAGMSTVRTAIARLEAEGWLTRKARRQGSPDDIVPVSPALRRPVIPLNDAGAPRFQIFSIESASQGICNTGRRQTIHRRDQD